jgi:hypothetical protein
LSAAVGILLTAGNPEKFVRIEVVGLLSIMAALLVGFAASGRYAERAERHRRAAVAYGAVRRELDHFLCSTPSVRGDSKQVLDRLRRRLNQLAVTTPPLSSTAIRLVHSEVRKGSEQLIRIRRTFADSSVLPQPYNFPDPND